MDLTIPGKLRQLKGDFILKGYFQHACFAEAVRGFFQQDFLLDKLLPDSANKLITEVVCRRTDHFPFSRALVSDLGFI